MRAWTAGGLAVAAALGAALATSAIAQAPAAKEKVAEPKVTHREEVLKTKPAREWPKMIRSWDLDVSPDAAVRMHELTGAVPKHVHPDAVERVFIVEGEVHTQVGETEVTLRAGDYISIPKGAPHKVWVAPGQKALAMGIHMPAADPKKIVWIEPAPGTK